MPTKPPSKEAAEAREKLAHAKCQLIWLADYLRECGAGDPFCDRVMLAQIIEAVAENESVIKGALNIKVEGRREGEDRKARAVSAYRALLAAGLLLRVDHELTPKWKQGARRKLPNFRSDDKRRAAEIARKSGFGSGKHALSEMLRAVEQHWTAGMTAELKERLEKESSR